MWNPPEQRPRVSECWRLRNDSRYVVAYRCTTTELKHKVLTPAEATIIPFLDGTLSSAEILELWKDVCGELQDPGNAFLRIIGGLQEDGIIVGAGDRSPSLSLPGSRLIPDFARYYRPPGRLDRPLAVILTLTNRCQANCRYCYAERESCDELPVEQWLNVFDDLASNEIFIVDVAGGDLLAHSDALKLLRLMTERQFVFFVSTKCLISPATAEAFAELGIGVADAPPYLSRPLQISVDSMDPGVASSLVGWPNHLQRAVESVRNTIQAGLSPRIKAVLTRYNHDAPERLVEGFAELGVTEFQFVQYGRSHYRHDDSLFLTLEQKHAINGIIARLCATYPHLRITGQQDVSIGEQQNMAPERWRQRAMCSGGRTNMVVKANGDVTLCDQVPHSGQFVVGNVFRDGVMGVWNSPSLYAFNNPPREAFQGTVCFDCREFKDCHDERRGYCYREALFAYGTIYDAPPDCPFQLNAGTRRI
jgi:radical SAM protein with 4Fe4S-binding SPASM domain